MWPPTCPDCGKTIYTDRMAATRELVKIVKRGGNQVRVYQCPKHHWHLTSKIGITPKRSTRHG